MLITGIPALPPYATIAFTYCIVTVSGAIRLYYGVI